MYPNLFYFFYDVFGIQIPFLKAVNSFGFFVALSFLAALSLYARELKRKEAAGIIHPKMIRKTFGLPATPFEIGTNVLLGFFLGFKLIYAFMHSEVFSAFPDFIFSGSGSLIGGIIGAAGMGYWRYYDGQKSKLPKPEEREVPLHTWDHLGNILMLAIVFGFLGAKIFAYLETPGSESLIDFLSDPFRGLTMYGGLICAAAAITIYFVKNKLSVIHFYDAAAPGLMLAYGLGRMGCHISGDGDWGIENTAPKPGWMSFLPDWMWSYNYPNNVNSEGIPIPGCVYEEKYCNALEVPVFPTPLYEFMMCIVLFFILWYFRKKISAPGVMFMLYLTFNGVERFLIESIRVNTKGTFLGLQITQAQFISFSFILAGIIGIIIFKKRYQQHKTAI